MIDDLARLDEVRRYDATEALDHDSLQRLAELAARICAAPVGFINLVGETQHFIARWGLSPAFDETTVSVADSFCWHPIRDARLMVIEDAAGDPRFAHSTAVTGEVAVRFYAGAPLVTPVGFAIGTVCVIDRRTRELTTGQERALLLLRDEIMNLLETRRELCELRRSEGLRQEAVEALMATQQDLQHRIELRTRDLAEAHAKSRQLLERVGDAFVAIDRDWHYVYVNQRAAQLFGRTPAELIGKHIWTEFPEGVGQPFHRAYERAMREQISVTLESCYQPWDRWFENRIYPSPEGISVFFTEITERKRAQAELERANARLVEAQRVASVGSWEWEVAANHVVWSEELYRIYGLTHEEFRDGYEGFLARVHANDVEHSKQVVGDALAKGGTFIYDHRIVRPDGSVRMLHTRGEAIVEEGKVVRLVGSCWDVTTMFEARRALVRTVSLLEATLEITSDGLLVVDAEGKVAAFNQRFASLWHLAPAAHQGSGQLLPLLEQQLADPALLLERVRALEHDQESVELLQLKDGRALEMRSRAQHVDGEVAGRVWSFREPSAAR